MVKEVKMNEAEREIENIERACNIAADAADGMEQKNGENEEVKAIRFLIEIAYNHIENIELYHEEDE